jgi:hypothetical protein
MPKPKKQIKSPKLSGNKIKVLRKSGKGQRPKGMNKSISTHLVKIGKKHAIRKRRPGFKVKTFKEFQKIFPKASLDAQKANYKLYLRDNQKSVLSLQKSWYDFYIAGLPVPKFSKIDLRKSSPNRFATYMEDVRKRFGKLEETHVNGRPIKILELDAKENKKLVKGLAKDLATIFNLGYYPEYFDFWHFYGKGKSKNRVILDFDSFKKIPFELKSETKVIAETKLMTLLKYFQGGCKEIFYEEFYKHLK